MYIYTSFRLQLYPPIHQLNHFTLVPRTPSIPRMLPEAPADPAGSGGSQQVTFNIVITLIPT